MASIKQRLGICLWFDGQAEEAAKLYTSIFKNSGMGAIVRYGKEGYEIHHHKEGEVMTVAFTLDGQEFMGLNGGPDFKFNEAMSIVVNCADQGEIDYYWNSFIDNGGQEGPCGWLKDKFGVSWQIVPVELAEMLQSPDKAKTEKVTHAFMQMKKLDINKLKEIFNS